MTETEVWLSRTPTKLRGCRRTLRTVEIGLEGTYRNALARAQLTAVRNDRVHVITAYAGRPVSVWITGGDFCLEVIVKTVVRRNTADQTRKRHFGEKQKEIREQAKEIGV